MELQARQRAIIMAKGKQYTPMVIPPEFRVGSEFNVAVGHFETKGLNLLGNLIAQRTDGSLRSGVWDLLRCGVGSETFQSLVIFNIRPWAGGCDEGKIIMDDFTSEEIVEIDMLTLQMLEALGSVRNVGGFGGAVHAWLYDHNRFYSGVMHAKCCHLSIFTRAGRVPQEHDFPAFSQLCIVLGGQPGAGEALRSGVGLAYEAQLKAQQEGRSLGGSADYAVSKADPTRSTREGKAAGGTTAQNSGNAHELTAEERSRGGKADNPGTEDQLGTRAGKSKAGAKGVGNPGNTQSTSSKKPVAVPGHVRCPEKGCSATNFPSATHRCPALGGKRKRFEASWQAVEEDA